MTKDTIAETAALKALLSDTSDHQLLAEMLGFVADRLMALDVDQLCGAGSHERSAGRVNHRNGYRERRWETRAGAVGVQIPKLRKGSYFPEFLEPRRASEKAMTAVIQEAYIQGVSTRSVDELVKAMGMTGISKSQVSRLCVGIDERVDAFLVLSQTSGEVERILLIGHSYPASAANCAKPLPPTLSCFFRII